MAVWESGRMKSEMRAGSKERVYLPIYSEVGSDSTEVNGVVVSVSSPFPSSAIEYTDMAYISSASI
jgi:hypothetical protein